MLDGNVDRAGIGEQFEVAGNTSNLSVEPDRRMAADLMIAAGWSPATLGGAIMRMHSEFGRPPKNAGKTDAILVMGQLKTMPAVVSQIEFKAIVWGMDAPLEKARAVVAWWLDHTCRKCNGHGKMLIPGTPVLSNRLCPKPDKRGGGGCGGTGKVALPHGEDSKRLAVYMDDCVNDWHASMKRNLAQHRRARNKVVETAAGRMVVNAKEQT